jgi:hypothetical protein
VSRGIHVDFFDITMLPHDPTGYVSYPDDYANAAFTVPKPTTPATVLVFTGGWHPAVHRDGTHRTSGNVMAYGYTWRTSSANEKYVQTAQLPFAKS